MAGRDRTSPNDVFINCPFDEAYGPTFRALIFAAYACGFRVRSARELDDAGQTRVDKLYGLIEECRYGIHDLSRTELDAVNGLPRFNMPLKGGSPVASKHFENKARRAYWSVHLEAWRKSGLTRTVYCRQHKLWKCTFDRWLAVLGEPKVLQSRDKPSPPCQ